MRYPIMNDSTALGGFIQKWHDRWPEWRVAEVFVPVERRDSVFAWFALLQEFDDAFAAGGDPLPADAKLGWWGQELQQWQEQRSRHPLGRVLEPLRAPWALLAQALPKLSEARVHGIDAKAAHDGLADYGTAVAEVERTLFANSDADATVADVGEAIVRHTLATRLMRLDASHELAESTKDLGDATDSNNQTSRRIAAEWLRQLPHSVSASVPRRLQGALLQQRLRRFAHGREPLAAPGSIRMLWQMWRAASGGRWNKL